MGMKMPDTRVPSSFDEMEIMRNGLATLESKMTLHEQRLSDLEKRMPDLRRQFSDLKTRVDNLIHSSKTSPNTRADHRDDPSEEHFETHPQALDNHTRDLTNKLHCFEAIRRGDVNPDYGDALGDAILFHRDPQLDPSLYQEVYGLGHEQVRAFDAARNSKSLVLVLNAHGTLKAQGWLIDNALDHSFKYYIKKVEQYWLQTLDREPNLLVELACEDFWTLFDDQLHSLDRILHSSEEREPANSSRL
ncbi:MAG: hypothetical protein Q9169_007579 [Polycauliona sp. 2 TL-2023]